MTLQSAEIILRPVISEKSLDETQRGKYTFRVHTAANKHQVKDAIEDLFKVDVVTINVSTMKPKEKSRNRRGGGRVQGWTSKWKRAVVTLAAGQKIEFFEGV
jgi:large subunit ribosomal protein L23